MIRCYYPICLGIGLSLALATGVGASAAVDCGEPAPAPRTLERSNPRTLFGFTDVSPRRFGDRDYLRGKCCTAAR